MHEQIESAERIWILGSSCAGKSTLAKELSMRRSLRAIHLDELFWQPNWGKSTDEELRSKVLHEMKKGEREQGGWVADGNYTRIRTPLAERVQFFVWLDLPRRTLVHRLVRRTARRIWTRQRICGDNRERLWSSAGSEGSHCSSTCCSTSRGTGAKPRASSRIASTFACGARARCARSSVRRTADRARRRRPSIRQRSKRMTRPFLKLLWAVVTVSGLVARP